MYTINKLEPINEFPIDVDYNHVDENGGIILDTRGAIDSIEKLSISLKEGQVVWISDTELDFLAVIIYRNNNWVAVPIETSRKDL